MSANVVPRVGLCGFTMAMEDYALRYPVVEIQHTFYDPPSDDVMRRWLAVTPASLEYTVKAWQLITHDGVSPTYRKLRRPLTEAQRASCGSFRESRVVDAAYRRTLECARLLNATAILFQCPARFAPTDENIARMRAFFHRIERPPGVRMLWEPRGKPWLAERRRALELCAELDLVHVVDPFVTPPEPGHPVYFRLHGLNNHARSYTDAELAHLKQLLVDIGARDPAYVMFNEIPRAADAVRFLKLYA